MTSCRVSLLADCVVIYCNGEMHDNSNFHTSKKVIPSTNLIYILSSPINCMLRKVPLWMCPKKPVSEEWKALARKQAAPYRSDRSPSPAGVGGGAHHGHKGKSGGNAGATDSNHSHQHRTSSSSSTADHLESSDPRSMRHFFGSAKYDANGNVIRDIDPMDLEQKIADYHLSRYR